MAPVWISRSFTNALFALGLASLAGPVALAAPTDFSGRYSISTKGVEVGEYRLALRTTPQGGYEAAASTKPVGLFGRVLRSIESRETARGRYTDTALAPERYEQEFAEDGGRTDSLRFDPAKGVIEFRYKDANGQHPYDPRALDPLSLRFTLVADAAANRLRGEYTVATRDSIKSYRVHLGPEARTTTPLGSLVTRPLTQQREGSSRTLVYHLAPSRGWIPVRIVQFKEGKEKLSIDLEEISGRR
ncbi:MAG: DUF3108 domain-containing protein [Gammaproteobacteria bacterium]